MTFGIPALVLGGLVALVEEPQVLPWLTLMAAVAVAAILVAWRWPIVGGVAIALFGLTLEYQWFTDQLGGSVQAFLDSLGDVSPLWFTVLALIAGAFFVYAGILQRRTTH